MWVELSEIITGDHVQGIYAIKNNANGMVYVGQTRKSKGIKARIREHVGLLKRSVHGNDYLQKAWNKYGENTFSYFIIEEVICDDLLDTREQHWIDETWNSSYNLHPTANSPKGFSHTPETRLKIGEANKKRIWSEESKTKLSESQKNRYKNKPESEETKKKRSESHIGKKHTQETKEKIRISHIGKYVTDETREKLRISHTGKKLSLESIENRKSTMARKNYSKGFKGVKRKSNLWQARISYNRKTFHLGYFKDEIEAAHNFDYHVIKVFGKENCYINFPYFDYDNFVPKRAIDYNG